MKIKNLSLVLLLAITIDGEDANAFPTTNTYTAIVNCSNGAGTATNPYKVAY